MPVLGSLRGEHVLIARVLDAAERYSDTLAEDGSMKLDDLAEFASFITDFGDLWHHAKEEEFLLPEMVRYGLAWDYGPVAHAREEHEQEAYLSRALMQLSAQHPLYDEVEHRLEAIAALRAYVAFQRHHMKEEEEVLYRRATEILPITALDHIERRCRDLESHRFGGKRYEEMQGLAEVLVRRHCGRSEQERQSVTG